ncbi:ModE family transcriptional regulator [Agarivorans sp. OAG1]|uniref:TOBE domain-containing protein n=1 Tax=Agarivorans sp. OAG1 TaxID=3082387 RepID=UPI002B321681|nr:ModE family transcriptional regulator [Agarivorans sp. OAG1]
MTLRELNHTNQPLMGKIKLCSELGPFLSDKRIKLLEAITEYGSLSAAAKSIPMSYKAAWDALDAINNLSEHPLVIKKSGGKHGGGTRLTDYGIGLLSLYRALELEYQQAFEQLKPKINEPCDEQLNVVEFRQLMRRMSLRCSARNQLLGQVVLIDKKSVNCLVKVAISRQLTVNALLSMESVEELNLTLGSEVLCLIKASQVSIRKGADTAKSNTNQFVGRVSRINKGPDNLDISVQLAEQKNLSAIVPSVLEEQLDIKEQCQVAVSFSASAVIICSY